MNPNASIPEEPSLELLTLFPDAARWQEWLCIEEERNCDIGSGRDWVAQLSAFLQDPTGMESLAQLRDWLLNDFRLMLIEWGLRVMTDAMFSGARLLLIERFRQPPMET